jgi:glycosyltransferase involved in cell wall biosynthesis
MDSFHMYHFEYIFAENGSTDNTLDVLKAIASQDDRIKVIVNTRNFGARRSGYNAFRHATGDCVIQIVSDLQDPPEVIRQFIEQWENGYKIVIGVKNKSRENPAVFAIRKLYYRLIRNLSESEMIDNFSGFALYDRAVVEYLTAQDWPPPYIRGIVGELGYERYTISYTQENRKYGKSSYSLLKYLDLAISGITSYSSIPLRVTTVLGCALSLVSLLIAVVYFIIKLIHWNSMPVGMAPLVIGLFFFASIQIFCIGLVGEYVVQVFEHVKKKPLVVEKERIGF